jgi:hypothetical protein
VNPEPAHFATVAWPLIQALKPEPRTEQDMTDEPTQPNTQGGPWTRHGHSVPGVTVAGSARPNLVARCGGPAICADCALDAERLRREATP